MSWHALSVLRALIIITTLLSAAVAIRAQPQRIVEEAGLNGYVLAPDGTPVSSGSVVVMQSPSGGTATIERTGRFRLIPNIAGPHRILVSAPGLTPHLFNVMVPLSRAMKLPVIRLGPPTYFRLRFVTTAGETINSPRLRRQSLDLSGVPIVDTLDHREPDQFDSDGTVTIGPLPRGVTMLALDMPPLPQTRLSDLFVTGADSVLDAGTITVQPGAVLDVDLVDAGGTPVPYHELLLEDAAPPSPLSFPVARTNQQGRATFDRLAPGRYRLRTSALGYCGRRRLSIARVITVSGSGSMRTRIVVNGSATFRFSSPMGPIRGMAVTTSPEASPPSPPSWLRASTDPMAFAVHGFRTNMFESSCTGKTDADGRVTFTNFPPGPARVSAHLQNSSYVRRVNVPEGRVELAITIPDGLLPLRVTDLRTEQPIASAAVTWTSGGGRVEAGTTANGDALLEAVGNAGGTLAVRARGYEPGELRLEEPAALSPDMALTPVPVTRIQARVMTATGAALANAIVELLPGNPLEVSHVAATDSKGAVMFSDAPSGALRLVASAEGFVPAMIPVPADNRDRIGVTLSRGYRVIATTETGAFPGPHLVRVLNEAGQSMEGLLDSASDRSLELPGRVSIGPLPPGVYMIELHSARRQFQKRVTIVDRDVSTTFP